MKALKDDCKNNRYVIATTLLLVLSTEVFCGIINYDNVCSNKEAFSFCFNIFLRIAFLIGGVFLAYYFGGILNHEYSGIFALLFTVLTALNSNSIMWSAPSRSDSYDIVIVLAMVSLVFYYVNTCCDSLLHTIFYYVMITVLAIASIDKIEFFIVLLIAVFMFATKWMLIVSKSARIVNYMCITLAVIGLAYMFVEQLDAYLGIIYIEGARFHPEAVILTAETFGSAECFAEIANTPYIYTLTNIIGHFGKFVGIVMCAIIMIFVASILVKCFGFSNLAKPADIVAAMLISVKCFAGLFENFAIISGMYVRVPILADNGVGYLVVGLLLGLMIASRERLGYMKDAFIIFFGCFAEQKNDESEEYENV